MYERILRLMRQNIRIWRYVLTLHAEEEMTDDDLTIFDIERAILTGEIIERQSDQLTDEWKYLIAGQSVHGEAIEVVAKISVTGKLVIITVYRDEVKCTITEQQNQSVIFAVIPVSVSDTFPAAMAKATLSSSLKTCRW